MASRRCSLLPTKLHPRQAQRRSLARPGLLAAIERCAERPASVISGPAGAGKSSAVAAWIAQTELDVAWLSLDSGDDRPARFFAYLFAALAEAGAGLRVDPQALLDAPQLDELETLLADELVIPLAARTRPLVVVLDDVQLIADADILRALDWLIEQGPACLRLMLLTRAQPRLSLARARARGLLAELGPAQLYFDVEETARFLDEVAGLEVDDHAAQQLHEQVEGWPAGTQLAALAWSRAPEPGTRPEGRDRFIADYLLAEVFAGLDAQLREFLLESAVLERFCAPLLAAVGLREDAEARGLLADLEGANLFLIPLDTHARWFRYHHLFREFLRPEAEARGPAWIAERHGRAAQWLAAEGLRGEAFEHAVAAGDEALIQALFERWAGETLMQNHSGEIRRWLAMVPRELAARAAIFPFIEGWCEVIVGQLRRGRALLEQAAARFDVASASQPDAALVGTLVHGLGPLLCVASLAREGRFEDALALSRASAAALEGSPAEHLRVARGAYAMHDALVYLERGELERAEAELVEAEASTRGAHGGAAAVRCLAHYAQLHRRRGRLDAAERCAHRALALAASNPEVDTAAAGLARVELAWVALERGHAREALDGALEGVEQLRLLRDLAYLVRAAELCARAHRALGELDEALELVDENLERLASTDMEPALARMQGLRAELEQARPQLERAESEPAEGRGEPLVELPADLLTPREREVLGLMAVGASNRELARRLYVSVGTIKTHVHRILHKLEVPNRTHAVHRARRAGWV